MGKRLFVKNEAGIVIKKCCASCKHKEFVMDEGERHCQLHDKDVYPKHVCEDWQMCKPLCTAVYSLGKVKCSKYICYVKASRRRDEKKKVKRRTAIEDIRMEYECKYGSIYMNF